MSDFFVLGNPVKHSLSPIMYNAAFNYCNLNYKYDFAELNEVDLENFFTNLRLNKFFGASVTVPYKEKVLEYCDELSDNAVKIGAVNCVYFKDNKIVGDNTDWYGFITALQEVEANLQNKKILIIGAGGAARACVFALQNKAQIYITNRTTAKGKLLASEFNSNFIEMEHLAENKFDIIVNATLIGLNDKDSLNLPLGLLAEAETVFDLIYKETQLVKEAKKLGLKIVDAKRMLLWQGVKQFEHFTNLNAPVEIMWNSISN